MTTEEIIKTEYSEEFAKLQKNRVVMSFFKYGPIATNYGKEFIDAVGSIKKCIAKFEETKNTEYLVDAANYCMFGWMYPTKGAFFKATESKESAGISGFSIKELESFT